MAGALTIRELITRYAFKADTKPIKTLDSAVGGFKKRMAALDQKIRSLFTGMAKVAAIGAAGTVAAIIKMGSAAEESEAKFDAVFKDQGATVREWSEQVAKSMGRSEYKLREFAAGLQDTFVPLGFARDTAAQMSMNLVELSEDVASFQNKASPEVMRDFQSALVGNHETVRKYGIIITQARLDKKIAAMKKEMPGFNKLAKEQQKVLARQKLIFEGTSDAQGDAHRTAGSFANQMKRVRAQVEDVAKKVGMKLMPILAKWLKAAGDWINKNEELLKQKIGEAIEKIVEAFKVLGQVLKWIIENWKTLVTVLGVLVAGRIVFGIGRITKNLLDMGNALIKVTTGGKSAGKALGDAIKKGGGLAKVLGKVGAVGAALGVGWQLGKLLDKWFGLSDKISKALHEPQKKLSEVKRPIVEIEQAHRALTDQARRYAKLAEKGVKTITTRGGQRIALTRENIQAQLTEAARRMGYAQQLGPGFAEGVLKNIPTAARAAARGQPSAPGLPPAGVPRPAGAAGGVEQQQIQVGGVTINVPPGTDAAAAGRLVDATTKALTQAMRQAMGDVGR
jgi:hypothetical protein